MKSLPAALLAFLQSHDDYGFADLFQITLPNGQTIYATSCQVDIVYSGHTYYASQYGTWERGVVTSEAGFDLRANDMPLTMIIDDTDDTLPVYYPGTTIPMMLCVCAGLFDGSQVTVLTAYWPAGQYPNSTLGVETKFVGRISEFQQAGRSQVTFRVADYLYLLNLKTPPNLIQANCRFTFGDANCGANLTAVTVSNSVAVGSTTQTINLTSAVAASVYAQGFITFTSGQNAGMRYSIKAQPSTTQIVLAGYAIMPLSAGDAFTMTQGCNKTQNRCAVIFGSSYSVHYGGQDYVPNPEVAV